MKWIRNRFMSWVRRGLEQSFLRNPKEWLVAMFGGSSSATGLTVTPATALGCPTVYACVRIISEDLASLPLITYRRRKGGRERDLRHALYPLLHDAPNPECDAIGFSASR